MVGGGEGEGWGKGPLFGDLDAARHPGALHAAGEVDGLPPHVEQGRLAREHSRRDGARRDAGRTALTVDLFRDVHRWEKTAPPPKRKKNTRIGGK